MHASIYQLKKKLAPLLVAFLFVGTQVVSTLAISFINTPNVEAAISCVNDTAGANDEPGQKDLTRLCVDNAGLPTSVFVSWNWDDLGTSGANTQDACALFDSDTDGNINFSACVTTSNSPATLGTVTLYQCTDSRVDRCQSPNSVISGPYATTCGVNQQNTDPFLAGNFSPQDTVATCTFVLDDFNVNITSLALKDVCSYPSNQPGSDPSDCVIIKSDPVALVELIKNLNPTNDSGRFNLTIDGPGTNDTNTVTNQGHLGTTGIVGLNPGSGTNGSTATVSEVAYTGASLTDYSKSISCVKRGTSTVVSATGTGPSWTIPIKNGDDIVCTITNTKAGSITIAKNAIANSLQDFGFTATGTGVSNFTLDDDSGVVGADTTNSSSKTFNNLGSGTYTFTESSVNGWYLDAIDCPDITETKNLETRQVSLTITAGQNITCTFTNRQLGQINVTKQTNPNNDPTQFAISASPSNGVVGSANQNISDNQTVTYTVKHGTYAVSETVPSGWTEISNNCSNLTIDGNTPLVNGVPTLSCTINNTKYSSITFIKDAVPNGPQDFVFNTSTNLSGFILDDDTDQTRSNSQQFTNLLPGTYSAEEVGVTGWDLTNATCSGLGASFNKEGSNITIDLGAGQNISCTFTNTQRASITGQKFEDVNGNGVWDKGEPTLNDWNIWIDLNNNDVYDDGIDQSMLTVGDGVYLFENILPGSYSIFEVLQDGWTQTLQPNDVVLDAGEAETGVDFGNFENNTVSGYKWNDIDGNAQRAENEPKLAGWTINLLNDGEDEDNLLDDIVQTKVTGQDGSYSFNNVLKGSYLVCEVSQNGWYQTYPLNDLCHSITVDTSGEVHSNTNFGNQGRGSITVKKDVDNDGDGDIEDFNSAEWTFDIDGSGNYTTGTTINNIAAGSHTINEDQKTDYHFVSVVCSGQRQVIQSESFNITVNPGDNITCTFTNARDTGQIKVVKYVDPNKDSGFFNLLIDGNVRATDVQDTGNTGFVKVITGSHQISETAGTGTDLDDYIANISGDCASDGSVNIAKDESKTCYITNTKKAKLTIIKDAYPNHEQDFGFRFGPYEPECEYELSILAEDYCSELLVPLEVISPDFILDDDNDEIRSNTEVIDNINPGEYFVEEMPVEGWELYDIYCDYGEENGDYDVASIGESHRNGQYIKLTPGADVTCTFINVKNSSVTIVKDSQPDSSQSFTFSHNIDGKESADFDLVDDGSAESNNSQTFDGLNVGKYGQTFGISEHEVSGNWRFDSFTCTNDDYREDRLQTEEYYQEGYDHYFWVGPGQDVICTFVNQQTLLFLEKTNNRPNPTVVGDTVTYTLEVSIPEGAANLYDVRVIDLAPENFKYVHGSWTAMSSERGDLKTAGITTEPTYHSPGQWLLGDMVGGEVITLTYQAIIQDIVSPGTYPDIAYAHGFTGDEVTIFDNLSERDTPFVTTQVTVNKDIVPVVITQLAYTGNALYGYILVPMFMILLTLAGAQITRRNALKGGK